MILSLQAYDGSDRQSGNIGSNNMVFLARAKSAFFVFHDEVTESKRRDTSYSDQFTNTPVGIEEQSEANRTHRTHLYSY